MSESAENKEEVKEDNRQWIDALSIGLEGMGWKDEQRDNPYHRLPAHADGNISDAVDKLHKESTGLAITFKTDSEYVYARWSLIDDKATPSHPFVSLNMNAGACSGLDIYARDPEYNWRWCGFAVPWKENPIDARLTGPVVPNPDGMHEYRVYLPLRNEITSLEIGIEEGATLVPVEPREDYIAYYGTSIIHGCSASRPGMTPTSRMSRLLDTQILNLGFAGAAKMEPYLGEMISNLSPKFFVLDPVANMPPELIEERALPFIRSIIAKHPSKHILMIEERHTTDAWLLSTKQTVHDDKNKAWRKVYETLIAEGDIPQEQLHYIEGRDIIGLDDEGTVDCSHPTDLGYERMIEKVLPVLKQILNTIES